jgi:hypothetical protein
MDSQEPKCLAGRPMRDPRDERFYALRKRDRSQLSRTEIEELIGYCDKMLQIGVAKKARRMWIELRSEYESLLTE